MSDPFTHQCMKKVVAKIATDLKFIGISEEALNLLVDSILFRLKQMARKTASITSYGGRTDSNVYDVLYALSYFKEDLDKLIIQFNEHRMISFDFLVEPYPLPVVAQPYISYLSYMSKLNITHPPTTPFRANMSLRFAAQQSNGSEVIPIMFFPKPMLYTYDDTTQSEQSMEEDQQYTKSREEDQDHVKKMIAGLLKNQNRDHMKSSLEKLVLTEPQKMDTLLKPLVPMLGDYTHILEGQRPLLDPEFLPKTQVTERMIGDILINKDTKNYLQILAIDQGTTSLNKVKEIKAKEPDNPPG